MSVWNKEAPEGRFIKFKAGSTLRLRLFGEPIDFMKAFKPADGPAQEAKQRFASLCVLRNKESGKNEVRIFEFGWEIQKALKALYKDEDWGDPTGFDIDISATGERLDRKYHVVPKPKKELDADAKALIEECDWDLEAMCLPKDGEGQQSKASTAPATDEYDPFADD